MGDTAVDLSYHSTINEINVEIESTGVSALDFSRAISLRARVTGAEINGRRTQFQLQTNQLDQHVLVHVPLGKGKNSVRIHTRNSFGISYVNSLPELGSTSRDLRVISETWSADRDALALEIAGIPGRKYQLALWNGGEVVSAEGARVNQGALWVEIPAGPSRDYVRETITLHFAKRTGSH